MINQIYLLNKYLLFILILMFHPSCKGQEDKKATNNPNVKLERIQNIYLDSLEQMTLSEHEHLNYMIHIGCVTHSDCEDHKLFQRLLDQMSNDEWISVIHGKYNPAIKGYAYIALTYNDYPDREKIYKPVHRGLNLMIGHIYDYYSDSEVDEFIKEVNDNSVRWKSARKANKMKLNEEEKEVLKIENKIRKEQGLDTVKVPK